MSHDLGFISEWLNYLSGCSGSTVVKHSTPVLEIMSSNRGRGSHFSATADIKS